MQFALPVVYWFSTLEFLPTSITKSPFHSLFRKALKELYARAPAFDAWLAQRIKKSFLIIANLLMLLIYHCIFYWDHQPTRLPSVAATLLYALPVEFLICIHGKAELN